ncbi:MAG: TatD family hydrolase [Eubacterium sp.]|nr:TatD family hydrolase [Eubacterium sp.]
MIFDTHAHYDDEAFDEDREKLLERMQNRGVEYIVNVGASIASCKSTIGLTRRFPYVYGALGIHPNDIGDLTEEDYAWLERSIYKPKIVAVGEIGLDYHWNENREEQIAAFERQIAIAREAEMPIIIHSRDAAQDTYDVMKAQKAEELGGVVHCFSYGKEMAEKFMDMGFYLGIGGVVTFKNARKIQEVVEYMPMEKMLLETDCPYMTPEPNRGKRNDSFNLPYVVNKIAEIKNLSPAEVIHITSENAKDLYRIGRKRFD